MISTTSNTNATATSIANKISSNSFKTIPRSRSNSEQSRHQINNFVLPPIMLVQDEVDKDVCIQPDVQVNHKDNQTNQENNSAVQNTNTSNYLTAPTNLSLSLSSSSSTSSTSSFTSTLNHTSSNLVNNGQNENLHDQSFESIRENDSIEKKSSLTNSNRSTTPPTVNLSSSVNTSITVNGSPEQFRKNALGSFNESTYKKQKEDYLSEKKRITNDMLSIMRDESIIILADWLKVRGSLKNWIKLYCILKPGIILLFKSDKMKPGHWVGTVILNSCQLIKRPSKKHGFCFKIFHPLERSIWASKGPGGETNINVPYILLPTFYLIFRAQSEKIGNIWMESIELSMKSANLLNPNATLNRTESKSRLDTFNKHFNSFSNLTTTATISNNISPKLNTLHDSSNNMLVSLSQNANVHMNNVNEMNKESNRDEDIANLSDSDNKNSSGDEVCSLASSLNNQEENLDEEFFENNSNLNNNTTNTNNETEHENENENSIRMNGKSSELTNSDEDENSKETVYVLSPKEEFGELGNKGQTEEVAEENKSLIFHLVKQVRPGMDLSKVVLPTFILEPRSFLEKLTDYYYHSNIISESVNNDDPYERMKSVVKFYLSGFYKKPKGLKKPYNPILGEVFRSYWYNPNTDSKTFYIAEQVSHHPPITSFYVTNRKEGFCIYGTVLARSKFYGNSVSAIMDGQVKLILLNRGEEYIITLPYANCKGILIGKLTMELGGKINIQCPKTGYSAEIEFKLKPLLGGLEASNLIDGKIKFAKETIAVINGKWDGEIFINEKRNNEPSKQTVLWNPTKSVIESRLKRFIVPLDQQYEFESEKLWKNVSEAIVSGNQNLATEEKTKIELKQRQEELERRSKFIEYKSKLFTYDNMGKEWLYKYSDMRPWDQQTDFFQYESEFKVLTKTKHNLKLNTRHLASPRTSIIPSRIVSNTCATNATESSYDVLMQYNEIKERLFKIENNLDKLNKILHVNQSTTAVKPDVDHLRYSQMNYLTNYSRSNGNKLILLLLAWLFGILTAILTHRILF